MAHGPEPRRAWPPGLRPHTATICQIAEGPPAVTLHLCGFDTEHESGAACSVRARPGAARAASRRCAEEDARTHDRVGKLSEADKKSHTATSQRPLRNHDRRVAERVAM